MKKVKKTIKITHLGVARLDYKDDAKTVKDISTIEAMSMLIARLAACFQYSDDMKEDCVFRIEITKEM